MKRKISKIGNFCAAERPHKGNVGIAAREGREIEKFSVGSQLQGEARITDVIAMCYELLPLQNGAIDIPSDNREQRIDATTITEKWHRDVEYAYQIDPALQREEDAARDLGVRILTVVRVMNLLFKEGFRAHAWKLHDALFLCQIDVHPKAQLDCPGRMDHVFGLIIGEDVKCKMRFVILARVTLGVRQIDTSRSIGGPRHPTIEEGVFLYTGSSVFGNVTVGKYAAIGAESIIMGNIGKSSTIGARAIIRGDVGEHCRVGVGAVVNHDIGPNMIVQAGEIIA